MLASRATAATPLQLRLASKLATLRILSPFRGEGSVTPPPAPIPQTPSPRLPRRRPGAQAREWMM